MCSSRPIVEATSTYPYLPATEIGASRVRRSASCVTRTAPNGIALAVTGLSAATTLATTVSDALPLVWCFWPPSGAGTGRSSSTPDIPQGSSVRVATGHGALRYLCRAGSTGSVGDVGETSYPAPREGRSMLLYDDTAAAALHAAADEARWCGATEYETAHVLLGLVRT